MGVQAPGLDAVELAARQQARAGRNGYYGMLLLVGAEVVFFVGLIWVALEVRRRAPVWPPADAPPLDLPLLAATTTVLLASAATMLVAQRAAHARREQALRLALVATVALAAAFMAGQWLEFRHIGGWRTDPAQGVTFRTLFNVLAGFHAAHVAAGALLLGAVLVRALRGRLDAARHTFVDGAALFWYLVAAVWLVLLAALLLA